MTKILVGGNSYTYGFGLDESAQDPNLWVNKVCTRLFDDPEIDNISETGNATTTTFLNTAAQIRKKNYDVVIVGWGSTPRFNYNVGLELYSTRSMFANEDINLNNGVTIGGSYLKDIGDKLKKLSNDHWDILNLVQYVNILYDMQVSHRGGKLFFVNLALNHCKNYFQPINFKTPSELDPYVQKLLQASTRCDDEVRELYNMIHNQYDYYGGIQQDHWLNLYTPLRSMQVDDVSDTDSHPGYKSQQVYTQYLTAELQRIMSS